MCVGERGEREGGGEREREERQRQRELGLMQLNEMTD